MIKLSPEQEKAIKAAIELKDLSNHYRNELKKMIGEKVGAHLTGEIYVDGAADLHSKTAGIGGVIYSNGEEAFTFAEPLFDKTNNEAEYLSMIKGVQASLEINMTSVNIYSDSELVVKQVKGEYKIKNNRLLVLNSELKTFLNQLDSWNVSHVRRDKNTRADALSKKGMAEAKKAKK